MQKFSFVFTIAVLAISGSIAACDDDTTPASGGTSPDASTTPGGGDSGTPGTPEAGADAPSGGGGAGIQLTAAGTTYTLETGAQAAQGGNGYQIGATKIDGSTQRNLALIVNKAEAPGMTYVTPTPGTYSCTQPGAAPFTWARFQYGTPGGSIYQSESTGPGAASCSVTITSFGGVGESVKGTFSATLVKIVGSDPEKVEVTGSFDVKRAN